MTESLYLWSKTAADNDDADGGINFAENQAPSSVNNSARAMMAAIANYRDDIGGALVSTGSSNEYTITTNQGIAAHANGVFITFRADKTSTAAATTTIDGLEQKDIFQSDGTATVAGDIVSGGIYTLRYSSVADGYLASTNALTANLSAISALAVTDSNIIVGDGTTWVAESGATARTSLGVAIGTNVQAWDAGLDDIAALAVTDGNFIVGDGANWVAESGATAFTSIKQAATTSATGVVEKATDAEVYTATADKYLAADHIETASAAVTLTHASPTALDWDAGIYRTWTMTASVTLSNPTNGQPGTWRTIRVVGDDTTDRTITFDTQYVVAPTITDVDSAQPYLLTIFCHTSSIFYVFSQPLF